MLVTRPRARVPELFRIGDGDEFENLFRRIFPAGTETSAWKPAVELVDMNEEYLLTAELPGIDPADVDVTVEENILTLRGLKKEEHEEKEAKYHVFERVYGAFERSFTLPPSIDVEKIRAEFKNGVVKIHMPKTAKATGRRIEVAVQ